jgi:hypothetical protein
LTTEQIIQTREFSNFYKEANDFCDFIENYQSKTNIDFLQAIRQHLIKLYDTALKLQWIDLQSNVDFGEKLDDKEFAKIVSSIASRLEDSRYYWHVYDPTNNTDTKSVCGDLVDDLSDIYKDLKYAILIFNLDKADCKENALWEFKFDFDKHWDNHCINALNSIHFYLQNE